MPSNIRSASSTSEFALDPPDAERLANLSGAFDAHLRMIELRLGVEIANRGNVFRVAGPDGAVGKAEKLLRGLWHDAAEETNPLRASQASIHTCVAGAHRDC